MTTDPIGQATANLISAANEPTHLLATNNGYGKCEDCGAYQEIDNGQEYCPRCDPPPPEWDETLEAYYQRLGFQFGARVRSHSDLDLELRQCTAMRCPSCGGQTGTYDGKGQWYQCGVCHGTGYREGVVR